MCVSLRTVIALWFVDYNIGSLNVTVSLVFTSLRRHCGCCIVGCLLQRPRCFDQIGLLRQTFCNKQSKYFILPGNPLQAVFTPCREVPEDIKLTKRAKSQRQAMPKQNNKNKQTIKVNKTYLSCNVVVLATLFVVA